MTLEDDWMKLFCLLHCIQSRQIFFLQMLSCVHLCRTAGSGPLVGHKGGFTWRFHWLKITTGGSFSRRRCNRLEALFFLCPQRFPTSLRTAPGLMGREPGFSWTELTVQRCCVHHPVWNAQHPGKKTREINESLWSSDLTSRRNDGVSRSIGISVLL